MEKFIITNNILEKYVGDEEHVVVPNGVTHIKGWSFAGCESVTSIVLPDSVTCIEYYAFSECTNLASVAIPNSVTTIEDSAFTYCTSLTSVTIPNGVTTIEDSAFSHCVGLKTVTFEEGSQLTNMGNWVFSHCDNLTSVAIPNSITSIGEGVFSSCVNLVNVVIPSSVTSIGSSAFSNCSSLTSVAIPESVTSIGSWAFSNCTNLGEIIFEKGAEKLQIAEYAFTKTSVKSLDLTRQTYIWGENFPNVREIKNLKNLLSITNFKNFDLNTTTKNGVTRYKNIIVSVDETVRNLYLKNGEILSIEALSGARNLEKLNLEELSIPLINYFEDTAWYRGDDFVPESLKEITIRKGGVADRALHHLTHIETVVLGEEVTSLGYLALNHNYELAKLIIKNNKCKITKAINNCDKLVIYR